MCYKSEECNGANSLTNVSGKWGRESQAVGGNSLRDQIDIRAKE